MGSTQQFSLRWNNYLRHITSAFDSLRTDSDLVDVTLSCEGKKIRAHKMLLSACSTYFRDLFKENPCQHPVIIFRNVKFDDLEALIDFMYQGEVNVVQEQLASFLTTAELLAVQGLTDGTGRDLAEAKEDENPDAAATTESEVQSSKKQTNSTNNRSSPQTFYHPPNQRPESPPGKRRKWSSSAPPTNSQKSTNSGEGGERERKRPAQHQQSSNDNSDHVEIIPVVPQVKVEMPEFLDSTAQLSYDDSGQDGDPLDTMSILEHGIASTSGGSKGEGMEIYAGNSEDTGEISSETMTPAELSQVLSKAGPSGENAQDSLQAKRQMVLYGTEGVDVDVMLAEPILNREELDKSSAESDGDVNADVRSSFSRTASGFTCNLCLKTFLHRQSLYHHSVIHSGQTVCPVCRRVFSRIHYMKQHLRQIHGIEPT